MPWSLFRTVLWAIVTCLTGSPVVVGCPFTIGPAFGVPCAKIPSPVAPHTVKPVTLTQEWVILMPLSRPVASILA